MAGPKEGFAAWTAIGFAIVTTITTLALVVSVVLSRSAAEKREVMVAAYSDGLDNASRAQLAAERMVAVSRGLLLVDRPELEVRVRAAEAELLAALDGLAHRITTDAERRLVARVRRAALRYVSVLERLLVGTTMSDTRQAMAAEIQEDLLPARQDLDGRLRALVEHWRQLETKGRLATKALSAKTFRLTVMIGAAGVVVSGVLAFLFTRRLARTYRGERQATERARRANEAKEVLLGVVAHDLRNPLSAIVVNSALIRKRAEDSTIVRYGRAIGDLAIRMDHMVGSLLDAAAMEAGRFTVGAESCRPSEMLAATLEMFAEASRERSVQIELRQEGAADSLVADRERILQVLSNLVGNALKFTPAGGQVSVSACASQTSARFEVRDTGPGIPPQQLPHIFERFWKADPAGRRGAGLGLFIAKGIVESHGGRIWVESAMGAGSSFVFEIPNRHAGAEATDSFSGQGGREAAPAETRSSVSESGSCQ